VSDRPTESSSKTAMTSQLPTKRPQWSCDSSSFICFVSASSCGYLQRVGEIKRRSNSWTTAATCLTICSLSVQVRGLHLNEVAALVQ
jgi:hypothetical protein